MQSSMPKILLIGSTCVDVIIEIDHLPKTAEDIQPKRQTLALGGCAYNAANIVRCPVYVCDTYWNWCIWRLYKKVVSGT